METELLYRIALTMIPELGPVCIKALTDHFGDAVSVFKARKKDISAVESIGELRARSIKEWTAFHKAEAELGFIQKHHIKPLFLTDAAYPRRLLHCYDPPAMLYYKGNADLNHPRIISIIGTRNHTEYGKHITQELVASLKKQEVMIVSGLAFGIDAVAHKACLQHSLPTIGVMAHGMHTLYPSQHQSLAREMTEAGGLVTEFPIGTKPDRHNFPKRNRIVAGMADAVIVIETAVKGGSMITAELAHSYNRDLFAVPGRITDAKSSGCLKLIQQHKAVLLTDAEQLVTSMGWEEKKVLPRKQQRQLFTDLSNDERIIIQLLEERPHTIDDLCFRSGLSASATASAILSLELQNLISALPGKIYRVV